MTRPEIISKLSFYLMDKEPLIYLFIINSDFIPNHVGLLEDDDFAAVCYRGNRVQFYYTQRFIDLPLEDLYFILIHEAQHIFKHHLSIHKNLDNAKLRNIAEDAIINTEIENMKFLGLTPHMPTDGQGYTVPDDFIREYSSMKEDAYTTPRLYNWYLKEQTNDKKDFLLKNGYCKDEKGVYGKVVYEEDDKLVVKDFKDLQEAFDDFNGTGGYTYGNYSPKEVDNLTPVIMGGGQSSFNSGIKQNWDFEFHGFVDPSISDKVSDGEPGETENTIPQRIFTENIVKQASQMVDKNEALKAAQKAAGINNGNSLTKAVERILKSKVNWKEEFKQGLNMYISDRGTSKGFKQSYITHLLNPRSRYGMLGKHKMRTTSKEQSYVIVAIDTSGSCFYDEYDKERFFSEIDAIAKEMQFSNSGKVYTLMWDWSVSSEELYEYKVGDWKNYKLTGGGGTNPKSIFRWLENRLEVKQSNMVLRLNERENLFIKDKSKLPFMLVLTDGFFYGKFKEEDLRFYSKDKNSVMFVARSTDSLYKGAKSVLYI
jgi:predicted metal-dependent peptidase